MNREHRPNYNAVPEQLMAEKNLTEYTNGAAELTPTADYISCLLYTSDAADE